MHSSCISVSFAMKTRLSMKNLFFYKANESICATAMADSPPFSTHYMTSKKSVNSLSPTQDSQVTSAPKPAVQFKEQDINCECKSIVHPIEPTCRNCHGVLQPFISMLDEKATLKSQLDTAGVKIHAQTIQHHDLMIEHRNLQDRNDQLDQELSTKKIDLANTQRDMQIMGEKLIDEIEKRAELQHSTETIQDELETLTKSLFEEANLLVSSEARKRHHHETREKSLEQQLVELKARHAIDLAQLKELKLTLVNLRRDDSSSSTVTSTPLASNKLAKNSDNSGSHFSSSDIDPVSFQLFRDFFLRCSTTKVAKLHTTSAYLKIIYEQDIELCLKFPTPTKFLSKKILEAILNNTLSIHELSALKVSAMVATAATEAQAAIVPEVGKTLMSQISAFGFSSLSVTSGSSSTSTLSSNPMFSACTACSRTIDPIYHFTISDSPITYHPVCRSCRARLASVCDFYSILRNISSGLYVDRIAEDVWWELTVCRSKMFWARVGASGILPEDKLVFKSSGQPFSMPAIGKDALKVGVDFLEVGDQRHSINDSSPIDSPLVESAAKPDVAVSSRILPSSPVAESESGDLGDEILHTPNTPLNIGVSSESGVHEVLSISPAKDKLESGTLKKSSLSNLEVENPW